jgi:hypothetical protein
MTNVPRSNHTEILDEKAQPVPSVSRFNTLKRFPSNKCVLFSGKHSFPLYQPRDLTELGSFVNLWNASILSEQRLRANAPRCFVLTTKGKHLQHCADFGSATSNTQRLAGPAAGRQIFVCVSGCIKFPSSNIIKMGTPVHPLWRSAYLLGVLAFFIPQVQGFHGFSQPVPPIVAHASSLASLRSLGRCLPSVGRCFQTRQRNNRSSLQTLISSLRSERDGPNDISYSTALVFTLATIMTIAGFISIENSVTDSFIQEAIYGVDHSLLLETSCSLQHP